MAKKPATIEVGDDLLLKVDVVRVDEHGVGGTVTPSGQACRQHDRLDPMHC
jgi:hypothetical protein